KDRVAGDSDQGELAVEEGHGKGTDADLRAQTVELVPELHQRLERGRSGLVVVLLLPGTGPLLRLGLSGNGGSDNGKGEDDEDDEPKGVLHFESPPANRA